MELYEGCQQEEVTYIFNMVIVIPIVSSITTESG
jgi:hypothetical protein